VALFFSHHTPHLTISSLRRCLIEKASVDEVYLDLTEEALSLMKDHSPESFLREVLAPVLQSKVVISLNPQPAPSPEQPQQISDQEEGSHEADEEASPEQEIHNICTNSSSFDSMAPSFSSSPLMAEGISLPTWSPEEWLTRPLAAWYSDANEKEQLEKEQERLLVCASFLVTQIRKDVLDRLGFTCSAGIARTKLIAKVRSPLLPMPSLLFRRWPQR
jgi:nucleotidyltransferase/DNA polymerase involved in DNA repair